MACFPHLHFPFSPGLDCFHRGGDNLRPFNRPHDQDFGTHHLHSIRYHHPHPLPQPPVKRQPHALQRRPRPLQYTKPATVPRYRLEAGRHLQRYELPQRLAIVDVQTSCRQDADGAGKRERRGRGQGTQQKIPYANKQITRLAPTSSPM